MFRTLLIVAIVVTGFVVPTTARAAGFAVVGAAPVFEQRTRVRRRLFGGTVARTVVRPVRAGLLRRQVFAPVVSPVVAAPVRTRVVAPARVSVVAPGVNVQVGHAYRAVHAVPVVRQQVLTVQQPVMGFYAAPTYSFVAPTYAAPTYAAPVLAPAAVIDTTGGCLGFYSH